MDFIGSPGKKGNSVQTLHTVKLHIVKPSISGKSNNENGTNSAKVYISLTLSRVNLMIVSLFTSFEAKTSLKTNKMTVITLTSFITSNLFAMFWKSTNRFSANICAQSKESEAAKAKPLAAIPKVAKSLKNPKLLKYFQ